MARTRELVEMADLGVPGPPMGENHTNAKLSEDDVREMRRLHKDGNCGYGRIAKHFRVSRATAYQVIRRFTWAHVTDE